MRLKILIILISIICSFSCIYVETSDFQYHVYVRQTETGEEQLVDTSKMEKEELYVQMANDFFSVKEQNEDMVGWLNIPNIGYFPVPSGKDNQYYLKNNEYKQSTRYGVPFLNTGSERTFKDIALIHGHHMKNGDMFGSLSKYQDEQFFQKNDSVTIFDGEKFYEYMPFTVCLYKDGQEKLQLNGMKPIERNQYLKSLMERSQCKVEDGVFVNLDEQILLLSTCDYTFQDARLLVGFYKIKEVEYDEVCGDE